MISRYACIFFIDVLFCDGAEFGTMVVQTSILCPIGDLAADLSRVGIVLAVVLDIDVVENLGNSTAR